MKLIVTAGGQGKKIWPLSREAKPKQFQAIVGKTPLYQQTIETLLRSFKAEDIFISTKKRYSGFIQTQSPQIPKENLIFEPDIAKDRGPGEGLAFLTLSMNHPDEPFMIVQSDVLRTPDDLFLEMITEAEKVEIRDRKFMSGGIKANYPILGIDYLRLGKRITSDNKIEVFETDEFIPRLDDYNETKKLITNFYVATHSNHNCWYPDLMLDAYARYRPDWHGSLMQIRDSLTRGDDPNKIDEIYSQMPAGATELVTANLFKGGYTILLPFKWTDIGTWDSVYEFAELDDQVREDGNVISLDSKRSLVKNTNPEKIIAVIGIDNLIVIDTDDALLVCDKSMAQEVKTIVETLKDRKIEKFI